MKWTYLKHAEINKELWDQSLIRCSNRNLYAYSWYLDTVCPGWNALVAEDYSFLFPLTWRKKIGIHYLFQPPFSQQLGIYSSLPVSESIVTEALHAIPANYKLVEIQLNSNNHLSSLQGFEILPRKTFRLDLSPSYENIYKRFSENLKRNIKKAKEHNLKIATEVQTGELIRLFRQNKGREIRSNKSKDYEILKSLVKKAALTNKLQAYGIEESGLLIAGAIFINSDKEFVFLFSATNEEARKKGAMSLIIDFFIKENSSRKMELDFEGSMDPGLARYYSSFGSSEVVYLQIKKNNLPPIIRWIK